MPEVPRPVPCFPPWENDRVNHDEPREDEAEMDVKPPVTIGYFVCMEQDWEVLLVKLKSCVAWRSREEDMSSIVGEREYRETNA